MYTNTTGSSANYYYYTYPQPSVCPGCGRCRECGQTAYPHIDPWITWNGTAWNTDALTLTPEDDANERDE